MKWHITFFLLVTLGASVFHFLIVFNLTLVAVYCTGALSALLVPVLWLLTAPMQLLMSTSFGQSLSPTPLQVVSIANSVLWGGAIAGITLWWKVRYD